MTLREKLYEIIFGHETRAGKRFDVYLLWVILFSVVVVMLESVPEIGRTYPLQFLIFEWIITGLFTAEFLLRIWISPKPLRYIFSFWGAIDFLSILPTYLILFSFNYHYLLVVRIFRLLRVFRILKLARFNIEVQVLKKALKASRHKISIFLMVVIVIVTSLGTIMYVVEGGKEGFTSIPQSIYWAIVTVTTVGYGDMVPHTVFGKIISSVAMVIGYAIIAVPTSIVTVEISNSVNNKLNCKRCNAENSLQANFCQQCGLNIKPGSDSDKLNPL